MRINAATTADTRTSALPRLAPALPASVALDDEEDGDETDSATYCDDAEAAQCVTRAGPRVRHWIYTRQPAGLSPAHHLSCMLRLAYIPRQQFSRRASVQLMS